VVFFVVRQWCGSQAHQHPTIATSAYVDAVVGYRKLQAHVPLRFGLARESCDIRFNLTASLETLANSAAALLRTTSAISAPSVFQAFNVASRVLWLLSLFDNGAVRRLTSTLQKQ